MSGTGSFPNPPIVELVIGAQFERLAMPSGYYGLFWKELGDEWVRPLDAPLLEDQFETFDKPRWSVPTALQFKLQEAQGASRFLVGNRDKSRLIQLQPSRLHLNWRKRDDAYPSYRKMVGEFETIFTRFQAFVRDRQLGEVRVNHWEVSYVDAFPRGVYWESPADWPKFLPGLFSNLFPMDDLGLTLEHRAAEWSFEIAPKRGRLQVATQYGPPVEGGTGSLLLQMTARGPVEENGEKALRKGLDLGHNTAVGAFMRLTSDDAKLKWG